MAKNQIKCPKCNRFVRNGTVYCPYCEEKIEGLTTSSSLPYSEVKPSKANPYQEVKSIESQQISLQQILQDKQKNSNGTRQPTQPSAEPLPKEKVAQNTVNASVNTVAADNMDDDEYYIEDDMPDIPNIEPPMTDENHSSAPEIVTQEVSVDIPEPINPVPVPVKTEINSENVKPVAAPKPSNNAERPLFRRGQASSGQKATIKERYEEQKKHEETISNIMTESVTGEEAEYDEQGIYNPNYDHYYDDVLPEVIAEIHSRKKEIILKSIGAVCGVFLIIVLMLYYLS